MTARAVSSKRSSLIPIEKIERAIYFIRGEKVMLDRDLAALYGVETKMLNRAVKAESQAISAGFHVSALGRRSFQFEVPNWHLKEGPRRAALSSLRFHRDRKSVV